MYQNQTVREFAKDMEDYLIDLMSKPDMKSPKIVHPDQEGEFGVMIYIPGARLAFGSRHMGRSGIINWETPEPYAEAIPIYISRRPSGELYVSN
jgi:hypothetical protein